MLFFLVGEALHCRISNIPHILTAVFNNLCFFYRAEKLDENTVLLHYYSVRMGLEKIVIGKSAFDSVFTNPKASFVLMKPFSFL